MTHGDEGSKLRYGAFCRVIKKKIININIEEIKSYNKREDVLTLLFSDAQMSGWIRCYGHGGFKGGKPPPSHK